MGRAKQQTVIRKWQGDGNELATVSSKELMNDTRYRTNPNVCRELTNRAVRAIKDWNYHNPENKLCITNALISELTGNVPKAIAKVTEQMDLGSYNDSHQLTPVKNRLVKQRSEIDNFTRIISIEDYFGIE
jgi:ethanolamine ammonia-lyase small subunit